MLLENNQLLTWEEAVQYLQKQPHQQELVKACYYDIPLQNAANRYWLSAEWQALQEFIPSLIGKALDIGAGNGITSYALARDGWHVQALEPNPSNLVGAGAITQLAEVAELPIQVVQEIGEQLPFLDASFELVFARQVLHHAQDLQKLCQEICRVLKPGGTFIAIRDHVISSKNDLPKFLETHPLHKLYGGENAFLSREYISALQQAGLRVNQVLKSFDSVINYAPLTRDDMEEKLRKHINDLPGGESLGGFFINAATFPFILKFLSIFDNRPGRMFSFICSKP
jgi:SAM-dependent methyltransferase